MKYHEAILHVSHSSKVKEGNEPKKNRSYQKNNVNFHHKFASTTLTFRSVKIHTENQQCLIKITTAKPYYLFED